MALSRDLVGDLRHHVEVQQDNADAKLASGEPVPKWEKVFEAFAAIEPLSGREFWNAVQVQANVTHKVTLHCRSDVRLTADMRLVLLPERTRVFHLQGPPRNLEERGDWWECLATEDVKNPRAG